MVLGERKVEYIELIYDLVFVYFLGRSNEILHHIEGGFFTFPTFLAYFLSTVVILQIWYQSTVFINRFGDNSLRNIIGIFINMYLIYYMAVSTRTDWQDYYLRYHIAWALILVNFSVQYYLTYRRIRQTEAWAIPHIKRSIILLLIQATLVIAMLPLYSLLQIPLIWVPLLAGFIFAFVTRNRDAMLPVNFEHLTERVMLFVVFTFGEMIISIAVYFDDAFSFNTLYFSLMAFLIVAGLFLSYGFLYNHVIDRQMITTGANYILLHVLLLVALCNLSAAMIFMTEPGVKMLPKNIFLVSSFLIYFIFLILLGSFSKKEEHLCRKTILLLIACGIIYILIMAFAYQNSYISLAASVCFIYAVHILLQHNHRRNQAAATQ